MRMCLGYHITEAYLVRVIPSAGLHEIIQQPVSFLRSVASSAE